MDLRKIAASLTPEERAEAPRSWQPNPAGIPVRVIDPAWLRRLGRRRLGLPEDDELGPISLTPAGPQTRMPSPKQKKEKTDGEA